MSQWKHGIFFFVCVFGICGIVLGFFHVNGLSMEIGFQFHLLNILNYDIIKMELNATFRQYKKRENIPTLHKFNMGRYKRLD